MEGGPPLLKAARGALHMSKVRSSCIYLQYHRLLRHKCSAKHHKTLLKMMRTY